MTNPWYGWLPQNNLKDLGYTVLEAGDAGRALQILEGSGEIALLITDVGLPGGMNGRQLAEAVREKHPDLHVLFITGYAENAVFNHGHLERGMHMMGKPFQMDAFAKKVAELVSCGLGNLGGSPSTRLKIQ